MKEKKAKENYQEKKNQKKQTKKKNPNNNNNKTHNNKTKKYRYEFSPKCQRHVSDSQTQVENLYMFSALVVWKSEKYNYYYNMKQYFQFSFLSTLLQQLQQHPMGRETL